jgi:hypothetical protein
MQVNFALKAGFQQTNKYKQFLFERNNQLGNGDVQTFSYPGFLSAKKDNKIN